MILAIDQGTTSSRALLINQKGQIVAGAQKTFQQFFPQPGWVEHDPAEIWLSVAESIQAVLKKAKLNPLQIVAIGITNQRETTVAWNRTTGKPFARAIVWQCRRTQKRCLELKKQEKFIYKKTGLVLDPYFSATKMQWLLQNKISQNQKKHLALGTIDSWLLWNLSKGHSFKTDVSNASRTMLMNLKTLNWDAELLKLFAISENNLPTIQASNSLFGQTRGLDFLPDGIPVYGILGDQQSALFGQTCFQTGEVKCTFGTGSFLLLNTGSRIVQSKHRLLSTVGWQLEKQKPVYALEGGAFLCGAAVQWLRDGLGIIKSSDEIETLARQVKSAEGVEFVPALTGLGAPYWQAEARGVICGLTRGATKYHLARATLDAMALQNTEILLAMQKDLKKNIKIIKVDGGATANNLLMQLQADYTGVKVLRPKNLESTALGAAFMAGLGAGFWESIKNLNNLWKMDQLFEAGITRAERSERLHSWQKAIQKSLL